MNMTYFRVAAYFLAPALALSGLGSLDAETMTLTIHLEQAASAIAAAGVGVATIFGVWGKK